MRHLPRLLALFLLLPICASAQVTIPFTFTSGTVASSSQVNSNFTQLGNQSLNRAGGIITGNIVVDAGITIDGVDISAALAAGAIGPTQLASTAVTAGAYGTATEIPTFTVDADGRLTAAGFTATSALTGIVETAITDGSLLARLAANEVITGTWTFPTLATSTTAPIVSWNETDGSTNEKYWRMIADTDIFYFQTLADNLGSSSQVFTVERSGITLTGMTIFPALTAGSGIITTTGAFAGAVNMAGLTATTGTFSSRLTTASRVATVQTITGQTGTLNDVAIDATADVVWVGNFTGNTTWTGMTGGTQGRQVRVCKSRSVPDGSFDFVLTASSSASVEANRFSITTDSWFGGTCFDFQYVDSRWHRVV